jgi:hypothetical protein
MHLEEVLAADLSDNRIFIQAHRTFRGKYLHLLNQVMNHDWVLRQT